MPKEARVQWVVRDQGGEEAKLLRERVPRGKKVGNIACLEILPELFRHLYILFCQPRLLT